MFPRLGASKLISTWIAITVMASIVAAVDGGLCDEWFAFAPAQIWRGEVWRLGTWVFFQGSPLGLVLTCACIYKFGSELTVRWGDRRLQRFAIEILGGAAVVTTVLALLSDPLWDLRRLGGWAVNDALVIAWARQYPERVVVLYGLVHLHGQRLVAVTIAITGVYAIYSGIFPGTPELLVCAAVLRYPAAWLSRRA
jgi:membrane associated rhomboid family serine protease